MRVDVLSTRSQVQIWDAQQSTNLGVIAIMLQWQLGCCVIAFGLAFLCHQFASAQVVEIKPSKYVYATPVLEDIERKLLTDGNEKPPGDVSFGRPGEVDIYFAFERPVKLQRVVVSSFKHTRHYSMPSVDLFVSTGADYRLAGHAQLYPYNPDPKAPLFDATSGMVHRCEFVGSWENVVAVRIRARSEAFMNLSEVRFFGQVLTNGKVKAKLPLDGLQALLSHLTAHRARNPETLPPADVPFARPWVGKRMRIFVLTNKVNQGEVVELAKRFDAQWHCPFWSDEDPVYLDNDFYGKLTTRLVQWAASQELNNHDYDAIVLGGVNFEKLGEKLSEAIVEKVKAGTNLLAITPEGKSEKIWQMLPVQPAEGFAEGIAQITDEGKGSFVAQLPLKAFGKVRVKRYQAKGKVLAKVEESPLVVEGQFGRGRIIVLTYDVVPPWQRHVNVPVGGITPAFTPTEGKPFGNAMQTNLWYGLVIGALLDLGNRWGKVAMECNLDLQANGQVSIHAKVSEKVDKLEAIIQSPYETSAPKALRKSKEGEFSGNLTVNAGENIVWLRALTKGKVAAWKAMAVSQPELVSFKGLQIEARIVPADEKVLGSVQCANAVKGATLVIVNADGLGKVYDAIRLPLREGVNSFALRTFANQPVLSQVRAWAELKGRRISEVAIAPINVLPNRENDFRSLQFVAWTNLAFSGMRPHLIPEAVRKLKECGITAALFNHPNSEDVAMAAAGLRICVLAGGIGHAGELGEVKSKFDLIRKPCLSDPKWREQWRQSAEWVANYFRRFAPLDYWFGDEASITVWTSAIDLCFSEHCLKNFREWLKAKYGDIETLNREWLTNYKSFDEVVPDTLEEVKGKETFAPWGDHRAFMDDLFAQVHREAKEALLRGDKDARISISGTQEASAYGGWDWSQVGQIFDVLHSYEHEYVRSLSRAVRLPWSAGYGVSGGRLLSSVWRQLLNGAKGISVFIATALLNGDLTPTQGLSDFGQFARTLDSEVRSLLAQSEIVFDPVAIHYSHSSIRAATALGLADEQKRDRQALVMALRELGIQPRFITSEAIVKGELSRLGIKVLFLPMSLSLSEGEVQQLIEFVRNGGMIVSLGAMGLTNEHLRKVTFDKLEQLLGAKISLTEGEGKPTVVHWRWDKDAGKLFINRRIADAHLNGRVRLLPNQLPEVLGKDEAGNVMLLRNKFGQGEVLCLLGSFGGIYGDAYPYASLPEFREKVEGLEALLACVLKRSKVEPFAKLQADGKRVRYVEICRLKAGEKELLGIVRRYDEAHDNDPTSYNASLVLAKPAKVRDLLSKRWLGTTSVVKIFVKPETVALFELSH